MLAGRVAISTILTRSLSEGNCFANHFLGFSCPEKLPQSEAGTDSYIENAGTIVFGADPFGQVHAPRRQDAMGRRELVKGICGKGK
jgi:hypothetical protein